LLTRLSCAMPACLPAATPCPRALPAPLQNSSDFYRWLSELEAARSGETEGKFRRYAAALEGHLATCDDLLAVVKQVGAVPAAVLLLELSCCFTAACACMLELADTPALPCVCG
jgi:hypothetical protein